LFFSAPGQNGAIVHWGLSQKSRPGHYPLLSSKILLKKFEVKKSLKIKSSLAAK
jgi:hypothetical protein